MAKLIASTLTVEDFEKAYSIMDVSPMPFDCGTLCNSVCCSEHVPGAGMYLLPGEEKMFSGKEEWLKWSFPKAGEHNFPPDWKGRVAFVMCDGTCPRDKRPIQCRTFPLMPYLDSRGEFEVKLDTLSGILMCPLVKDSKIHKLQPEFVKAVESAWKILLRDPLIRSDVWQQSRERDEDESAPWRKLF